MQPDPWWPTEWETRNGVRHARMTIGTVRYEVNINPNGTVSGYAYRLNGKMEVSHEAAHLSFKVPDLLAARCLLIDRHGPKGE